MADYRQLTARLLALPGMFGLEGGRPAFGGMGRSVANQNLPPREAVINTLQSQFDYMRKYKPTDRDKYNNALLLQGIEDALRNLPPIE